MRNNDAWLFSRTTYWEDRRETMNDRGSLNMRNITLAIREVVEWYGLGIALNIDRHKLDEIRINRQNNPQHCKFSLIDLWLRTDINASWSRLAAALDEAGEDVASGRIKEQYLGISAASHITEANVGVGLRSAQPLQQVVPVHVPVAGSILADGGTGAATPALSSQVSVPISAQAPVTTVNDAVPLLRTSQERLISGLTHSKLDVNYANNKGMTLLHFAAMQGADMECLKALIAFGANINLRNSFGQTPLDVASMSPIGVDMVAMLETVGAVGGTSLNYQPEQRCGEPNSLHRPDACNILSLSSSGPYCVVQLETLQQIEVRLGRKVTDVFQWVVACGFGALFLLLIIYGNKTMCDVKRLYFKLREEVFGQVDMARRSQALDGFLQAHLGTQMKMGDIQHPRVLIGALYKGSTRVETHLFNNCLRDDFTDIPVWKVARYTCSLPLNIMESDNYTSTDPALPNLSSVALRRIRQFYTDTQQDPDVIKGVVCLDDGQFDAQEMGCVDVPVAALYDNPHWFSSQGALQNLTQLLSLQQISSTASGEECVRCCQEWCERYHIQFFHFNPLLSSRHTLSVDVPLKDVVDSVVETISQLCGNFIDSLVTFINNV